MGNEKATKNITFSKVMEDMEDILRYGRNKVTF